MKKVYCIVTRYLLSMFDQVSVLALEVQLYRPFPYRKTVVVGVLVEVG